MKNMFTKTRIALASLAIAAMPAVAMAQSALYSQRKDLNYVVDVIIYYANRALFVLIGIAIVMFVWYVIQYFIKPDADRKEASKYVMYSLIGFFVVLSFWGLVNILQNTFGLNNSRNRPATWSEFNNLFPSSGSNTGVPNNANNNRSPIFTDTNGN